MLNIPSYIEDPNYRYKMPQMILKIEGKGNGIKTNITNLVDVATALRTDSEYILKFFGFEKATQITYKEINKNDITCIINGAFSYEDLSKPLDKFIEKYICCPKCKYPEMHIQVKKNKVGGECDSCGFNGDLDNVNKVAQFIIKKPPKQRIHMGNKKIEIVQEDNSKQGTVKQGKKKKLAKEDLELNSELLEELVIKLRQVYTSNSEKDSELTMAEMYNEIKQFGIDKTLTERLSYLIFNSIFNINIVKQVKDAAPIYKYLLKKFGATEVETLLNLQYLILSRNKEQEVTKFISTILKKLMDSELLTEEFIKKWDKNEIVIQDHFLYNKERNQVFKTHSRDFLDWLNDVDEEEDEGERQ